MRRKQKPHKIIVIIQSNAVGRNTVVSVAIGYGLDGPGIEFRRGASLRIRPHQLWCPPSLHAMGTGSFPVLCSWGAELTTTPSNTEVKEKVQLYPFNTLWAFIGCYALNLTTKHPSFVLSSSPQLECQRKNCLYIICCFLKLLFPFSN